MKKIAISLICLLALTLNAQIDYPTQPKEGYYEDLKKLILPVIPTEKQLSSAKSETIPANFKDTLLKYDWYEIASYFFFEKEYTSYFLDSLEVRENRYANNEFKFFRYTQSGIKYDMTLDRRKNGNIKILTTTFNENTATKLLEVKKVGTKNMMVNLIYGEKGMVEILSYKKGILILNISQGTSANKKFYNAYMAVPKTF